MFCLIKLFMFLFMSYIYIYIYKSKCVCFCVNTNILKFKYCETFILIHCNQKQVFSMIYIGYFRQSVR